MNIGMIGLGRMGSNMVRRLQHGGHSCVVYDRDMAAAQALQADGATPARSLEELLSKLPSPKIVWVMVPAGAVDSVLQTLQQGMKSGDVIIDGGNSYYGDDIRRAEELSKRGLSYLDVGTSGGTWGLERGYCLMIGGERKAVQLVEPILATLAPGAGDTAAAGTAARGYLHVGKSGAGHFVKMVHNGIEYGLMAAYAEGFNILHHVSNPPKEQAVDAETAPSRLLLHGFDFKLEQVAELWRHGSVVSSWLLDLLASQLGENPQLSEFAGKVADSGEGRWTVEAAIESNVPVPVLATALFARFSSRGESDFADRMLSAMRLGFGGHRENSGK